MSEQRSVSRALALLRILFLETSPGCPMPMKDLLRRMEEEGLPAERKTVYRWIQAMNENEITIGYAHRTRGWYYAGGWLDGTEPDVTDKEEPHDRD